MTHPEIRALFEIWDRKGYSPEWPIGEVSLGNELHFLRLGHLRALLEAHDKAERLVHLAGLIRTAQCEYMAHRGNEAMGRKVAAAAAAYDAARQQQAEQEEGGT